MIRITALVGLATLLALIFVSCSDPAPAVLPSTPPPTATAAIKTQCLSTPILPSSESPLFTYAAPDNTIWAVNADGTSKTQLICNSTGPRNASWSPSGTYLAYVDGDGNLRMLNVETGEDPVVDDGSEGSLLHGASSGTFLRWSPAGDMLLYTKFDDADRRISLGEWVVSPGGSPIALNLSSTALGLTWSPDGLRLVYHVPTYIPPPEYVRSGEIFLVNADGTGDRKLVDGIFRSWSPDGRLLAYWTENRGGSSTVGDIVIMEVDTGRSVSLGEFTSDERPAWSPDQSRNVFHNMEIDATATTATPLFDRPGAIIDWSPDGTKVAYVDGYAFAPPPRSLVVLDTRNGEQTTLHTSDAYTAHVLGSGYRGVWSPDGRYYAYQAIESVDEEGVVLLYVTDTKSGETNRLWEGTVLDSVSAAYAPDGSKLLVEIEVDRSSSVWLANPDGTALTEVAEGQALRSSIRLPAWRPAVP